MQVLYIAASWPLYPRFAPACQRILDKAALFTQGDASSHYWEWHWVEASQQKVNGTTASRTYKIYFTTSRPRFIVQNVPEWSFVCWKRLTDRTHKILWVKSQPGLRIKLRQYYFYFARIFKLLGKERRPDGRHILLCSLCGAHTLNQ